MAALWITWPLGANLPTHLPAVQAACRFDAPLIAWSLAHQTSSLSSDWSALPHAPAFHPSKFGLFYGEAAFGALPLFAPVFLLTGNPTLASNVMFLAAVVLTTLSIHLVVRRWTGSDAAGLAGSAVFLTSRWLFFEWPPCNPNYAILFYVPWIIAIAVERGLGRWSVAVLAALFAGQAIASSYLAVSVFLPFGLLGLFRVLRPGRRKDGGALLAALVLGGLLAMPWFWGYVITRAHNPEILDQTLWVVGAPPLRLPWAWLGYLSPLALPWSAFALVGVGWGIHLVSDRSLLRPSLRDAWAVTAFLFLAGFVVSVSPRAFWLGEPVELPNAWLPDWLPLYRTLRTPIRLGASGLIAGSLLVGLAFDRCARPLLARATPRATALIALALALALFGSMVWERRVAVRPTPRVRFGASFGAFAIRPAPVLRESLKPALAQRRGPVLEVPASKGGVPFLSENMDAMYRSIDHGRPVVNGYHGYWPAVFPGRLRLAEALPDGEALARLREQTGLETIVVDLARLSPGDRTRWLALANGAKGRGMHLIARDGDVLVFEVDESSPGLRR